MANILELNCFTWLDDAKCNFVISKVCQIADEYLLNFSLGYVLSIKSRVILYLEHTISQNTAISVDWKYKICVQVKWQNCG